MKFQWNHKFETTKKETNEDQYFKGLKTLNLKFQGKKPNKNQNFKAKKFQNFKFPGKLLKFEIFRHSFYNPSTAYSSIIGHQVAWKQNK